MPRQKRPQSDTTMERVQQQARALLDTLQEEIHNKESELARLKEEATALRRLGLGGPVAKARSNGPTARATTAATMSSGRVDWRAMLDELPKQFAAADIRNIGAAQSKRPSEIFAAITRWIEAGLVRRKARGQYERI